MRYAVSTRESEGNKEIIWGLSNQFDFLFPLSASYSEEIGWNMACWL